jgi:lipoprotein-releasing system ATP-binding protein
LLEVVGLNKDYATPGGPLPILRNIALRLDPGESACILGPSGSGKSTLLHILGVLEPPSSGRISLAGVDPFALSAREAAVFRNRRIGFVFQDHCLLPQCSLLENVLIPTLVADAREQFTARARELLDQAGLGRRLDHLPGELSGGERQRAALARALIMQPSLLLCDEPTGNLDHATAETIADLLLELHARNRSILIVVTHNLGLASRFTRRLALSEGALVPLDR